MSKEFIGGLPKIELHLHLEGAIPLKALWDLIEKYNGVHEIGSIEQLEKKFRYVDFPHFIRTWVWKNNYLKEYEDFTFFAEAVAKDLESQNIRYVEAFYSPGDFTRHGLNVQKITESIRKGLDKHKNKVEVHLIADLIRDFGPVKGDVWLREIAEVKKYGVIGIGIGGSEQAFPPNAYKAVYELARNFNFKTTAHAGEAAGANSVWSSIKDLKVDRIGHGTRAIEDPALVDYLKQNKIPIEMCPMSNVRIGIVPDLKNHPIKAFYDQELLVSVNTDDPKMFNTTLVDEFMALHEVFGFEATDIKNIMNNAIDSAWCDETKKVKFKKEISKAFL